MKLRTKILIIAGVAFFFAFVLTYAISNTIVLGSFAQLEEENLLTNVKRVENALSDELEKINSTGGDWAPWNETRDFVLGTNDGYIEDNLNVGPIVNLGINFMVFLNGSNEFVHGFSVDIEAQSTVKTLDSLISHITGNKKLLSHKGAKDSKTGIIMIPESVVLLSAWPISENNYGDKISGTLVVGRYLDAAKISELAEQTELDLEFVRTDQLLSAEFASAQSSISENNPVAIRLSGNDYIEGYTGLTDLYGKSCLLVKVQMPRDIYAHGLASSNYFMAALVAVGAVLAVALLFALQKVVLGPVSKLTDHASFIAQTDNFSVRLRLESNDEIGTLSREFDNMVGEVAEARKKLMDQSFHCGMAELASGVLHNVRNTLTPITVEIEKLCKDIDKSPADQLEMARKELDEGDPSEERKKDLTEFLEVGTKGLVSFVKDVQGRLQTVANPIHKIEQILAEQDSVSRAEQPVEIFKLDELVEDSISLLGNDMKQNISIELDESVKELKEVKANRISLLQVFSNLLINASESIHSAGITDGRISISASTEQTDRGEKVHVQVSDNGDGITAENLERIFERGFSTKEQGHSGLGLHWCSNSLSANNGNIYGESEGSEQGANLHVVFCSGAN